MTPTSVRSVDNSAEVSSLAVDTFILARQVHHV